MTPYIIPADREQAIAAIRIEHGDAVADFVALDFELRSALTCPLCGRPIGSEPHYQIAMPGRLDFTDFTQPVDSDGSLHVHAACWDVRPEGTP